MKKLLIIGVIALVVIGCVLAAGCTSNTTTPASNTEDFIVGTWTDGKVNYVFTNDFKGSEIHDGTILGNFTWKKTADGKYEVNASTGVRTNVTLDKNKGTLTTESGEVISKKLDGTSGSTTIMVAKDMGLNFSEDPDKGTDSLAK